MVMPHLYLVTGPIMPRRRSLTTCLKKTVICRRRGHYAKQGGGWLHSPRKLRLYSTGPSCQELFRVGWLVALPYRTSTRPPVQDGAAHNQSTAPSWRSSCLIRSRVLATPLAARSPLGARRSAHNRPSTACDPTATRAIGTPCASTRRLAFTRFDPPCQSPR